MTSKIFETLHASYAQSFDRATILCDEKTAYQSVLIFDHPIFGRMLMLDGVLQTTQKDEFIYHEMFVHVPALAHGCPRNVLIIGGGDGGVLREVCRYQSVQSITMVEIDEQVVQLAKTYLPSLSAGAFDDPRLKLLFQDASHYIHQSSEKFDLILCDSTDPIGPGAQLFQSNFYEQVTNHLAEDGILVTQNGVSFLQQKGLKLTHQRLSPLVKDMTYYYAHVPTYVGGSMYYGYATNRIDRKDLSLKMLEQRHQRNDLSTRYYSPSMHLASFVHPPYLSSTFEA